ECGNSSGRYPDGRGKFFLMNDITLQERLQPQPIVPPAEEKIDFLEYWRAVSKRKWSIVGLTVLVGILAALIVSNIRPQYRGVATLLIEQGKSKVVSIEEVYSQGLIQREYYQTQVEILKSEELARKVVKRLSLTTHPDFDPRQAKPGLLARWFASPEAPASEDDIAKAVVARLKRDLQVQLVRNSQLVQISFTTYD